MDACTLCPRMCGVNRAAGEKGYCGMDATIRAARAALHMWEEPCISGTRGSGAVFFSGCSLRCIFCQNFEIAEGNCAKEISGERLSEIFLELQEQGAANINLVTAAHYVPAVIESLKKAKAQGMDLPVIYNSSGYERVETVQMLEEVVDVWLPDFKYMDSKLAFAYSRAKDYPEVARAAIREMMKAAGTCAYDEDGYIQKGVIVRHLILPGHTKNSIAVLDELYGTYGDESDHQPDEPVHTASAGTEHSGSEPAGDEKGVRESAGSCAGSGYHPGIFSGRRDGKRKFYSTF